MQFPVEDILGILIFFIVDDIVCKLGSYVRLAFVPNRFKFLYYQIIIVKYGWKIIKTIMQWEKKT